MALVVLEPPSTRYIVLPQSSLDIQFTIMICTSNLVSAPDIAYSSTLLKTSSMFRKVSIVYSFCDSDFSIFHTRLWRAVSTDLPWLCACGTVERRFSYRAVWCRFISSHQWVYPWSSIRRRRDPLKQTSQTQKISSLFNLSGLALGKCIYSEVFFGYWRKKGIRLKFFFLLTFF